MANNALGLAYPVGSDEFAPHLDIQALANSAEGRVIVPVANTTDRGTVAGAVSPSSSEPLYVDRANASPGAKLERTEDGTTFEAVGIPYAAMVQIGNGAVSSSAATVLGPAATLTKGSTGFSRVSTGIQVANLGLYRIAFNQVIGGTTMTSGRSFVEITLSAATAAGPAVGETFRFSNYPETKAAGSIDLYLSANTTVGLTAFQSSGTSRSFDGYLTVTRVGTGVPSGW